MYDHEVSPPRRAATPAGRRDEQLGLAAVRATVDGAAFLLAFALSYRLYEALIRAGTLDRDLPRPGPYVVVSVLFSVIAIAVFLNRGLYGRRASVLNLREQASALEAVMVAAAAFFALLFFAKLGGYSRIVVVGAIGVAMPFVILERRILAGAVGAMQRRGRLGSRVVIYDSGPTGRLLMKKIVQAPDLGYNIVGFLDDHAPVGSRIACRVRQTGPEVFDAPVLGRWDAWRRVFAERDVDELLIATAAATPQRLGEVFRYARHSALRVGVVPQLAELRIDQMEADDISAIPVLRRYSASPSFLYPYVARLIDVVGGGVLLLLTAPLWLAAAIAIRLDSPGPLLFVQERVGQGGRRFRMLKFRTMWTDAAPFARSPAGDVDPRITRVGRVLRATGLDELPQLWNVLRGDMALVGPRPEMPFIVEGYTEVERLRLQVRPGITGIWQLSADRHAEIHENIEYDLYYINHRSTVTDLLILVETLFFTLGQVPRILRRNGSVRDALPASISSGPQLADGRRNERYVLVALDQRMSLPLPERWEQFVPAAYALSNRWPVKVLASGVHTAAIDEMLAPTIRRLGARDNPIE